MEKIHKYLIDNNFVGAVIQPLANLFFIVTIFVDLMALQKNAGIRLKIAQYRTKMVGVTRLERAASWSQTNPELTDTRFWAFFGRFGLLFYGFQSVFSIVSVCSAAGWGQISGQDFA